jgi:hypothetical protein
MRASARLEAYLDTHPSTSSRDTSLTVARDACEDTHDADAALRALVRRRIELRLMGYDLSNDTALATTGDAVEHSEPLAAMAPDDGAGVEASSSRMRAADAILRRLVSELREDAEDSAETTDDAGDAWTPSGEDWNAPPGFAVAPAPASARAMREKYPELFETDIRTLGESCN